ncbi:hypothetical protein THAOC_09528 [Thalassiosira oceanica]|uniref:Uncharacterized protein n=1 Tax=Thalassiosira oceanica TaxID=159749 RepID=K0T7G6_THAOC|nr:hypothetical protein THAOC_09528 [Thalassiosira oceanica]|eukprot:EJK69231.1 hypothetical protein THAOC_09528 [Thalassiosira oceanica]
MREAGGRSAGWELGFISRASALEGRTTWETKPPVKGHSYEAMDGSRMGRLTTAEVAYDNHETLEGGPRLAEADRRRLTSRRLCLRPRRPRARRTSVRGIAPRNLRSDDTTARDRESAVGGARISDNARAARPELPTMLARRPALGADRARRCRPNSRPRTTTIAANASGMWPSNGIGQKGGRGVSSSAGEVASLKGRGRRRGDEVVSMMPFNLNSDDNRLSVGSRMRQSTVRNETRLNFGRASERSDTGGQAKPQEDWGRVTIAAALDPSRAWRSERVREDERSSSQGEGGGRRARDPGLRSGLGTRPMLMSGGRARESVGGRLGRGQEDEGVGGAHGPQDEGRERRRPDAERDFGPGF